MHVLWRGRGRDRGRAVGQRERHRGARPHALAAAGVTAIHGDLRDPSGFPERYDALIHAGAVIPARNIAGNDFAAVNIAATEALLAQAGAAGARRSFNS